MKIRSAIERIEVLSAADIDAQTLKSMVKDGNCNVFRVDNGCTVRAWNTYTNERGGGVTSYLHFSIEYKSGRVNHWRETRKGAFCNY